MLYSRKQTKRYDDGCCKDGLISFANTTTSGGSIDLPEVALNLDRRTNMLNLTDHMLGLGNSEIYNA